MRMLSNLYFSFEKVSVHCICFLIEQRWSLYFLSDCPSFSLKLFRDEIDKRVSVRTCTYLAAGGSDDIS